MVLPQYTNVAVIAQIAKTIGNIRAFSDQQ
jgi:hypothetical protein